MNIVVGPHTYTVSFSRKTIDRFSAKEESYHLGYTDTVLTQIVINPKQSKTQIQDTLLHEVLHACMDLIGYREDINNDTEEKLVRRLSPVLLQVIKQNPELLEKLLEA